MAQIIELAPQTLERAGLASPRQEARQFGPGDVYVIFTSIEETFGAVRVARRLAGAMRRGVTIVHFRPVDLGAALEEPAGLSPVETDAFRTRLEAEDGDTRIRVILCRDARQAIGAVIEEHSLVVVGGRRRWWPTPSDRWRRSLETRGYIVVFAHETATRSWTAAPFGGARAYKGMRTRSKKLRVAGVAAAACGGLVLLAVAPAWAGFAAALTAALCWCSFLARSERAQAADALTLVPPAHIQAPRHARADASGVARGPGLQREGAHTT